MAQLVKSRNGLAIASVKSVKGLAIASVKSILGLDNTSGGGGGAPVVNFSDTFPTDGANLGANWTADAGAAIVTAGAAQMTTTGYAEIAQIYTGTSAGSANQYALISLNCIAGTYPSITLRRTNAASPMYAIFFWVTEDQITWTRKANAGDGAYATIQTLAATIDTTDRWGVTIEGSGNSTVVRCWKNPTGNVPDTLSLWGGAGPTVSFTTDPASPVDTGNFVGIGGEQNFSGSMTMDNFYGGGF